MSWRNPTRRELLQVGGLAALGLTVPHAQSNEEAQGLYREAVVIDGLSFAREWDETELQAIRDSQYTGIIASLPRRSLEVAMGALIEWQTRAKKQPEQFLIAKRSQDFVTAKQSGQLAVLMNFQNAIMLEGDPDNVDLLHALGTRCIQLTYNERNLLGDGCTERTNAGLSDYGVEVVSRMNDVGVLIDLSHCGRQTTADGIRMSRKPVAITHSMCEALRPGHPRAKTDEEIRLLAERGGVFGVAALGYFLGKDPGGATTIDTYVDHIEHAVKIAGHEQVALATDFPIRGIATWATRENWFEPRLKGFKPSYDVQWPPWIPDLDTATRFLNLTNILLQRGWSHTNIKRLLGGNWLRLFRDTID